MNQLKVGLIGFGKWVREAYLPILREIPEVRVVAAGAPSETSRTFARGALGPDVAVYRGYEELLGNPEVEAVMIALPNALHAPATQAAAAAGKHVFFEPPAGLTEDEIRRTLHVLSRTDAVVQADIELRYLPVVNVVREQIQRGAVGDPLMARVRLWCDWGYGGADWVAEVEHQGLFLWLGCWYLDLLDVIYGIMPLDATVIGGCAMNGRIMDHGQATLRFPGGGIGAFEFSLVAMEGLQVVLSVAGTGGEIEADLLSGVCRSRRRGTSWQEVRRPCREPVHGFAGMRESITDFVSAVTRQTHPQADVEACRRIHAAALACTLAAQENRTVGV